MQLFHIRASGGLAIAVCLGLVVLLAPSTLDAGDGVALGLVVLAAAGLLLSTRASKSHARSARLAAASLEARRRLGAARADATDARRATEAGKQERDAFLRAVHHELRTPLNSIQGFTSVLLADIDGPLTDSQREDVEAIALAGTHLKALIDDVLETSSARPSPERRARVELVALVGDVCTMLRGHAAPGTFRTELPDEPLWVPGDDAKIRRILLNLGENARKHGGRGEVTFRLHTAGHEVRIDVIDRGPGIAHDAIEALFSPFARGAGSTDRGGWGLGLPNASQLASWHRGRIEVKSELGRGSTFTLVLPRGEGG